MQLVYVHICHIGAVVSCEGIGCVGCIVLAMHIGFEDLVFVVEAHIVVDYIGHIAPI